MLVINVQMRQETGHLKFFGSRFSIYLIKINKIQFESPRKILTRL